MVMATTIYHKRFVERRKEQHLCLKCGNPLDREGTYCVKCRKDISQDQKERRHWYQSSGICPRCGKNDLYGDEKMCIECVAKSYKNTIDSRERLGKEHYNEIHRVWAKNKHQERIGLGICTRCGDRKADNGYKTCGICRAKTREYKRMKYGKPDRRDHYQQGLCYFCDNPVKHGYKVCEKHYELNIKNLDNDKMREATAKLKKIYGSFKTN